MGRRRRRAVAVRRRRRIDHGRGRCGDAAQRRRDRRGDGAHPRIGAKPVGAAAAQEFRRREQGSAADADDETLAQLLAEGNVAYEQRFDRVFLIRAAGRSRAEIVGELHRRLGLDDDTELRIVGAELRDIALLRLQTPFAEPAPAEPDAEPDAEPAPAEPASTGRTDEAGA
ncbi:2-oxo-4-hydroxy-4-carboxy-5-ureidoimidazoline decarboxylase [Frigoribacterium sp. RIT-PI-h]|uniref:2-oxo-4-hydroxy-4-carboxy-5-ureidoimidazoline decarboxylase n=1 Tax=Frigoribacterium sp. RIT-PI-h TaxID=1690245 RepID=UPI0006B89649|nr:2-oxo-4-hydroxy-4-carboxy-5-ureidoimidazoline decarboxylase [Frigoribacterium sp. RIT-PI-h]